MAPTGTCRADKQSSTMASTGYGLGQQTASLGIHDDDHIRAWLDELTQHTTR